MTLREEIQAFWERFCFHKGIARNTPWLDCFHFEMTRGAAEKLLGLVLAGVKQATCSSLYSFQAEQLRVPKQGDLSIVTDWEGHPHCVIQTTGVTLVPYRDVTWDMAKREGEDTEMVTWRRNHLAFFMAEGKELGYVFSPDMMVVFEDFQVVYMEE